MEDEKETEKTDDYENDKQAEERGISLIYPSTDASEIQKFKEQFVVHG